ncbi:hypothetical protein EDB85DRAFT_1904792 [Lactarius pseudohatsudake]|nr:hypothetical protein EDB85DRAFT_1904792 [Lactarius pseudohatsudake]
MWRDISLVTSARSPMEDAHALEQTGQVKELGESEDLGALLSESTCISGESDRSNFRAWLWPIIDYHACLWLGSNRRKHFAIRILAITITITVPVPILLLHGCVLHETRDEWGVSRKGKRLGVQDYWEHRRHDKRLKYMEHQPDCEPSPDAAAPSLSMPQIPSSGMLSSEDDVHISVNTSGNSIPSISHDNELARSLQTCLSTFQLGSVRDVTAEALAFCEPSENNDPNTPPPLQSHATTNANFLEYQGWVVTLFLETDKMDCRRFEKCEKMKNQLLDCLRDEWNKLEDIKLRAWQRYNAARKTRIVPPLPDPGMAQVVDTCSCFL